MGAPGFRDESLAAVLGTAILAVWQRRLTTYVSVLVGGFFRTAEFIGVPSSLLPTIGLFLQPLGYISGPRKSQDAIHQDSILRN